MGEIKSQKVNLEEIRQSAASYEKLADLYEVWIPKTGLLAGRRNRPKSDGKRKDVLDWSTLMLIHEIDNSHFPLSDFYLQTGISGILDTAEETLLKMREGSLPAEPADVCYIEAVIRVWKRFARFLADHAALARDYAQKEGNSEKRTQYEKIAAVCDKLTTQKPESFYEALQLFWFVYLFRNPFGAGCMGRLDQYLYPFYQHDCKIGNWNKEEARMLLEELFCRLNEVNTGDTLRNLMLSGQDASGKDQTNEITYLILEAYANTQGAEPHLNVRFHPNTPKKLYDAVAQLLESGSGQPTIYFDEAILPAMEKAGIAHADACSYANDGCTETVIDGKSAIVFWQYEMVKTVELTLFNGMENPFVKPVSMKKSSANGMEFTPKTNLVTGFASGDVQKMETFAEFLNAFFLQMDYQLDQYFNQIRKKMKEDETVTVTSPFVAGTKEKCIKTGKDPLRGGGFDIPNYQLLSGSIGTAADSLYAIEKAVYQKKFVTMETLLEALRADFNGYEALQSKLIHLPKFGNDESEVDLLAKKIAVHFLERVNAFSGPHGEQLYPGLYNIDFKIFANLTGATPDGRKFGDAIAEHCSPTPGAAQKGPTAVMNSAAALPMSEGFASSVLHLTLDKSGYSMGANRLQVIQTFLRAAQKKKIPVFSLTMYDKEELEDAQIHPEKHRDLIVRVWGFQARFTELDRALQDHIINRIC